MIYIYWTIAIFLSFFLQGKVSILGVSLNLTVLMAYYAGIRYGEKKGMLLGAFIGALEDIITASILGPNLLAKGVIGFSSSFLISGSIFRWTPLFGIITISFLTFFDNSIVFLSRNLFDRVPDMLSTALFIALMQSLLNAPAGIFIRPDDAE